MSFFKNSLAALFFIFLSLSDTYALQCKSFLKDSLKTKIIRDLKTHQSLSFEEGDFLLRNIRSHKATENQSPSETYADYMQMRLNLLNPVEQLALQKAMEKKHSIKADKNIAVRVDPFTQELFIHLPKKIFGKISTLMALAHEMEHVVQSSQSLKGFSSSELDPKHQVIYTFNAERAAMTSEGAFLMSLPRAARRAELIEFKNILRDSDKKLDPTLKGVISLFVDALQASLRARNVKDYVKLNWKNGRYSRTMLIRHHLKVYPLILRAHYKNTN